MKGYRGPPRTAEPTAAQIPLTRSTGRARSTTEMLLDRMHESAVRTMERLTRKSRGPLFVAPGHSPRPPCRPTRSPEENEAMIQAGAAKMGIDPADHPARNWIHCARCRTWHRPEVFEGRAS